jgi:hypothetical protein
MKPVTTDAGPWWRKLAWFLGIWAASVAALGAVAWLLRTAIIPG